MTLTLADFPDKLRAGLGAVRSLGFPPQGMTSEVAIVETDTGRLVVKRAHHPLYVKWLVQEARVLRALEPLGLPVPRARDFAQRTVCGAESFSDCWLVMDYLPGATLAETLRAERDPEARRQLLRQWGATLAAIHATPAPRELDPLTNSWLEDRLAAARFNLAVYPVDGDEKLWRYLMEHRPAPVTQTLIHGDFTLDNTLVHKGKISGVIDWAFGALGDPRYDLALALDPEPGIFDTAADRAAFQEGYGSALGTEDDYRYFLGLYEFF
jgi:aminoglycoside phosphotransferase (APT) family kinase protein